MPVNSLVFVCLQAGTSASENKKRVRIDRRDGELILLFKTDLEQFKTRVGTTRSSDYLYVYRLVATGNAHSIEPYHLIFVELKGTDVGSAIDQLKETIVAFKRSILKNIPVPIPNTLSALVICSGCDPKLVARKTKEFYTATRVKIHFKSASEYDLRDLLEGGLNVA
jgi:hypothetical protein